MIGLSMMLVVVAAVSLVLGLLAEGGLTLIWVSIAACLVAGLFLLIGVLRLRPRNTRGIPDGSFRQSSYRAGGATAAGEGDLRGDDLDRRDLDRRDLDQRDLDQGVLDEDDLDGRDAWGRPASHAQWAPPAEDDHDEDDDDEDDDDKDRGHGT